jgi:putative hydrolase of the HAD superfamily
MIKTLIFDLGNVLVPFDFKRGYAALGPLCGFPAEEIPRRVSNTDLVVEFESGRISPQEFFRRFAELLDLRTTYERFCEIWNSVFLPCTLIPEDDIRALRERYRILLLSNTNALHFAMLRESYSILAHFDSFVLSHEVGAMKPLPRIYHEALARAECRPEECFYTDDVADYIEGARREGIDAVQFQGYENLKAELVKRGIFPPQRPRQ